MKMFYCFNFGDYIRFFVKVLIEMTVNISNELFFLCFSKSKQHWAATCSKVYMLHATQCNLHFGKPQKNEIHSLFTYLSSRIIAGLFTFYNATQEVRTISGCPVKASTSTDCWRKLSLFQNQSKSTFMLVGVSILDFLRWPTLISVAQRSAQCRHSAL